MATHDYDIADQNGTNFLSDLNSVLDAIVSQNSNATEPTTTYPYMWWADTSAAILKIRNAADSAWLSVLDLTNGEPIGGGYSGLITGSSLTMGTAKVLGRDTSGTGAIEELTLSEILDLIGSAAEGDLLYRASGGWARLPKGSDNQVLTMTSTVPNWETPTTSGSTLGTPTATTSGSSKNYAGLAGAKYIIVTGVAVGTNSSSSTIGIQLGDAGGSESTGYTSDGSTTLDAAASTCSSSTSMFIVIEDVQSATNAYNFTAILTLVDSSTNTWNCSGTANLVSGNATLQFSGSKSLSAELTQLSFLTDAGSFDGGKINVLYFT